METIWFRQASLVINNRYMQVTLLESSLWNHMAHFLYFETPQSFLKGIRRLGKWHGPFSLCRDPWFPVLVFKTQQPSSPFPYSHWPFFTILEPLILVCRVESDLRVHTCPPLFPIKILTSHLKHTWLSSIFIRMDETERRAVGLRLTLVSI